MAGGGRREARTSLLAFALGGSVAAVPLLLSAPPPSLLAGPGLQGRAALALHVAGVNAALLLAWGRAPGGAYQIAIRACFLGFAFGCGLLLSFGQSTWKHFGWYMCSLSLFHYSEYLVTAVNNPRSLSLDSFLLNHSFEYNMAAISSWVEFTIEKFMFPGIKQLTWLSSAGLLMVVFGDLLRKAAMLTAGSNFNHIVQNEKSETHRLVTRGVYAWFRHPSYVGWFYWSIGTQGTVLEKLRLYKFLSLLRIVTDGIPPFGKDPALLIQNQNFDGVTVRVYQPKAESSAKRKGFLFFHGGAGTYGSVDCYERIMRHISREADAVVVAVEYGLGPENPYPNQYTECEKAAIHFLKHVDDYHVDSSRIIVSGDSCGANFATRICQLLLSRSDLPRIHSQVLIYPGLQGMDFYLPSYQQNSKVPILWRETVIYFCCLYLNKTTSVINDVLESRHVPESIRQKYRKWVHADLVPEEFKARGYRPQEPGLYQFKPNVYEEMKDILEENFSPLFAPDETISKLPQTYILTCEFDVLRDDGLLYKRRLEDNGVPVTWVHVENGFHGVAILFGYGILSFPSAGRIVRETTDYIKGL